MPTITQYLADLKTQQAALAEAIKAKGIEAEASELLNSLVRKVSLINGNDSLDSLVNKTITEYSSDAHEVKDYTFYGCKVLKNVNMPNLKTVGQYAFANIVNAQNITMEKIENVGECGFLSTFAQADYKIDVSLPKLLSVGTSAFRACSGITKFSAPLLTGLSQTCFAFNNSCEEYYLPEVATVSKQAFTQNAKLTKLKLPKLTALSSTSTFSNCSNLKALILSNNTVASLAATSSFDNTPIASGTGYIYVPKALVDSYKTATNWSVFANQIRAIEDYPQEVE